MKQCSFWLIGGAIGWICGMSYPASAQIVPDTTLADPSVVTRSGDRFVITGGTTSGTNLFHSFDRFSVRTGTVAHFDNAASIRNIFSRVTGTSRSQIDGVIRANGTANLFLLNPNGILFGENAALNIGGSFLATTANRLEFADGTQFRADSTQTSPLLTVSAPIGLQFGNAPRAIVNQSIARSNQPLLDSEGNPLPDPVEDAIVGLSVPGGQTLALVGGQIVLAGGELTAAGGQIELGSVASPDRVGLIANPQGWRLDYGAVQTFGDIELRDVADVDASGEAGGTIRLRGDRVQITGDSLIRALTLGGQDGGEIAIEAAQVTLDEASRIAASTYGLGRGGDVQINAQQLTVRSGSEIQANTYFDGQGGNLTIAADEIELSGIALNENGRPQLNQFGAPAGSNLSVRTNRDNEGRSGSGRGGNLSIATNRLRIQDGAQIGIDALSAGSAGEMTIRATEIELVGVATYQEDPLTTIRNSRVITFPSSLTAIAAASGRSGDITLLTQRLSLREGATIQTSTQGSGDAGNLSIRARDVELVGTAPGLPIPTGLLTFSGGIPAVFFDGIGDPNTTGDAGNLSITTSRLVLRDGAVAAIGSLNENSAISAGNLRVTADSVILDRQAGLLANTNSGNGGQASFQVRDAIVLRRGSAISTTAGSANRGGNGGNIRVNADFVLSALTENSDITANAFTGNGGNVDIVTLGILGILPQARITERSDITASSERGVSGTISITAPEVDPAQGLVELPSTLVDASSLIAQTCSTSSATIQQSEFVVTGRGGLPPSPNDPRSSEAILTDWITVAAAPEQTSTAQFAPIEPAAAIAEAQGWTIGANGEVILTASAASVNPAIAAVCH